MDCNHPEQAIPDPKKGDLIQKDDGGYYYICRCLDCNDKFEVHLASDAVDFTTVGMDAIGVEVTGDKELRHL